MSTNQRWAEFGTIKISRLHKFLTSIWTLDMSFFTSFSRRSCAQFTIFSLLPLLGLTWSDHLRVTRQPRLKTYPTCVQSLASRRPSTTTATGPLTTTPCTGCCRSLSPTFCRRWATNFRTVRVHPLDLGFLMTPPPKKNQRFFYPSSTSISNLEMHPNPRRIKKPIDLIEL